MIIIDLRSLSLPVALVAVEPLNRRRVADTERAGRGPLEGSAPSLCGAKLLLGPLPLIDSRGMTVISPVVRAGGDAIGVARGVTAAGPVAKVVMGVLSVDVVGGLNVGLAGDFLVVEGSSLLVLRAEPFELDTAKARSVNESGSQRFEFQSTEE